MNNLDLKQEKNWCKASDKSSNSNICTSTNFSFASETDYMQYFISKRKITIFPQERMVVFLDSGSRNPVFDEFACRVVSVIIRPSRFSWARPNPGVALRHVF